jgi:hypothetical protein
MCGCACSLSYDKSGNTVFGVAAFEKGNLCGNNLASSTTKIFSL